MKHDEDYDAHGHENDRRKKVELKKSLLRTVTEQRKDDPHKQQDRYGDPFQPIHYVRLPLIEAAGALAIQPRIESIHAALTQAIPDYVTSEADLSGLLE